MAKINRRIVFDVGQDICTHTCKKDPCIANEECKKIKDSCPCKDVYNSDQGSIILRHPLNKEWNGYLTAKIESQNPDKDFKQSLNDIMCDLFDQIVIEITNVEDDDGTPLTLNNLDRIYVKEKTGMIIKGIELNNQDIILKNF